MNRDTIEKAVAVTNAQLRRNNQALRKNLKRLVECSAENEKAQERMDVFEALIFEADSLKEMFDSMITQGRRIFEIQAITAALDSDFGRFYPEEYKKEGKSVFLEAGNVVFAPAATIAAHFQDPPQVALRGNLREGNGFFFPSGASRKIRSEALAPLLAPDGALTGAICFGSASAERFLEGFGARFLDRLARLVSLKMEMFRVEASLRKL